MSFLRAKLIKIMLITLLCNFKKGKKGTILTKVNGYSHSDKKRGAPAMDAPPFYFSVPVPSRPLPQGGGWEGAYVPVITSSVRQKR